MEKINRIILTDADVVSHFITAGEAESIHLIFPDNPIHLLDKVHAELQNWKSTNVGFVISDLLRKKRIKLIDFPEENEEIKKEYFWIKKMQFKGDGESACLAVARFNKNILASSNLKDIKNYCAMHKIDYLTTMDFLCAALAKGIFDDKRCDAFLQKVITKGGKLPVKKMADYKCRVIDFL
ncbi:MAG TPA: hypothetical protein PLZ98_09330 [Chitinophagaceae bacterium]|nr:hypothetical protein [Chitinophagaceae bacterium]